MKITKLQVTIKGIRPLLMHNGRLRNPMDPHTKALKAASGKASRSKSDDDFLEVCKTEFVGSLYNDDKLGPVIPADNLQALLVEGARKRKLGKQFEALVEIPEPNNAIGFKLEYTGTRDPEKMFDDDNFYLMKQAKVGQSSVMRTRPRFKEWEVTFPVEIMEGGPDVKQVEEAIQDAGILVGLGDWTPRYGRFEVTSVKQIP